MPSRKSATQTITRIGLRSLILEATAPQLPVKTVTVSEVHDAVGKEITDVQIITAMMAMIMATRALLKSVATGKPVSVTVATSAGLLIVSSSIPKAAPATLLRVDQEEKSRMVPSSKS